MTTGQPRGTTLWWGTVAATDLLGLARSASIAGFTSVAATPQMQQTAPQDPGELSASLAQLGVDVRFIDPLASALPGSPVLADIPPRFREFFSHGEDAAFDAAEAFSAAVCVSGFLGRPVAYDDVLGALTHLAARAGRRRLRMLIEFMPGTQIPDLTTALSLLRDVDATNLGLVLDTWHFARAGGTTTDLEAIPPGVVGAIQVSDRDHGADARPYVPMHGRLMPGDGDLPLREWIERIMVGSPEADIGVEVFDIELASRSSAEVAVRAASALQSVLPN
jgi:sugar phosphate isomerase/epimerase